MSATQKLGSFSGAIRAALMNAAIATAETGGKTLFSGIISGSEEKGLTVFTIEAATASLKAETMPAALGIMTPLPALITPLVEKFAKRAEKSAPKPKAVPKPKAAKKVAKANPPKTAARKK